jgi:hypothetical protein
MVVRIGKTKIEVKAEGCLKCGALWSHRWEEVKEVPVQIGAVHETIEISVCGDCLEKEEAVRPRLKFSN